MKGSNEQFSATRVDPELQYLDSKLNSLNKVGQVSSLRSPNKKKFRKISMASKTSNGTKESCAENAVPEKGYKKLTFEELITQKERVEIIAPWELLRRSRKKKI